MHYWFCTGLTSFSGMDRPGIRNTQHLILEPRDKLFKRLHIPLEPGLLGCLDRERLLVAGVLTQPFLCPVSSNYFQLGTAPRRRMRRDGGVRRVGHLLHEYVTKMCWASWETKYILGNLNRYSLHYLFGHIRSRNALGHGIKDEPKRRDQDCSDGIQFPGYVNLVYKVQVLRVRHTYTVLTDIRVRHKYHTSYGSSRVKFRTYKICITSLGHGNNNGTRGDYHAYDDTHSYEVYRRISDK